MSTTEFNETVEFACDWLRQKHCTLWMDWDISTESGLQGAAEWFITSLDAFVSYVEDRANQDTKYQEFLKS